MVVHLVYIVSVKAMSICFSRSLGVSIAIQIMLTGYSPNVCPGVSEDHIHDQCRGVNAKGSERYTDMFAHAAHRAFRSDFDIV